MNTRPNAGNAEWHALDSRDPHVVQMSEHKAAIRRLEIDARLKQATVDDLTGTLQRQRYTTDVLRTQLAAMEASRNRLAARNRVLIEALQSAGVPIPRPEPLATSTAA